MIDVEALWQDEYAGMRRFLAYKLGSDRALADDLTSDVFMRAWERRHQYRDVPDGSPKKWLYTLAINRVRDHWRRRRLTVPLACGGASSYTLRFDEIETRQEVQAAVAALPEVQRAVIVGRFFEGYGERDLLHLSTFNGVKKLRARAFVNLRKRLQERVA